MCRRHVSLPQATSCAKRASFARQGKQHRKRHLATPFYAIGVVLFKTAKGWQRQRTVVSALASEQVAGLRWRPLRQSRRSKDRGGSREKPSVTFCGKEEQRNEREGTFLQKKSPQAICSLRRRGPPEGMKMLRIFRPCGIAAADFGAENSPPDCFLNAPHPLRVRIPSFDRKRKKRKGILRHLFFFFGPPEGMKMLRIFRPCGIAAADFGAENSPPDCFLNAPHPLRVRIPSFDRKRKKRKGILRHLFFFLARPKGFEPPIFRIGICCVIQLRHGRKYIQLSAKNYHTPSETLSRCFAWCARIALCFVPLRMPLLRPPGAGHTQTQSSESESAALSSCATGGNGKYYTS